MDDWEDAYELELEFQLRQDCEALIDELGVVGARAFIEMQKRKIKREKYYLDKAVEEFKKSEEYISKFKRD